ncbi:MAG: Ig-like domain-containing protein [Candidatus Eisenbacteria bacterium]
MSKLLARALCLAAILFVVASCSSTSDPSSVSGDPTVESLSPADGATDVGLVKRIEVEFSEAIDPATVNDTTLVITERGIEGFVEYDESSHTVTFTPDTLYAANSWFDGVVSDDVTDMSGHALAQTEAFSFQTGAFDCAHLTDYMEPNESIAQAAPIELARTYRTLSGCDSDTDFFEFTLTDTAKVLPLARFKRANHEVCFLYIRRYTGGEYGYIGSSVEDGDFIGGGYTLLPGTYYAEVMAQGGYEDYVLYDFSVNTMTPCHDDAYEDNDFFDEATPISPGTSENLRGCTVDKDFYAVHADSGQLITLTVDAHTGGTDTRQYVIYGPSEDNLAMYWDVGNPVTIDAHATETGTYYLFVRFWSDGYVYDMDVSVED